MSWCMRWRHLLEPSHNQRFYGLMGRFMPQWKTYRKELNRRSKNNEESIYDL